MLNEERIILMTQMASYEKGEGKENVKIGSYFRSDYLAVQVWTGIFCGTLAFAIGFGVHILCNFERYMADLYQMDLLAFARQVLTGYCVAVGSYVAVLYAVCTWRYAKAKKSLKCYYHNLKKLTSLYHDPEEE